MLVGYSEHSLSNSVEKTLDLIHPSSPLQSESWQCPQGAEAFLHELKDAEKIEDKIREISITRLKGKPYVKANLQSSLLLEEQP